MPRKGFRSKLRVGPDGLYLPWITKRSKRILANTAKVLKMCNECDMSFRTTRFLFCTKHQRGNMRKFCTQRCLTRHNRRFHAEVQSGPR